MENIYIIYVTNGIYEDVSTYNKFVTMNKDIAIEKAHEFSKTNDFVCVEEWTDGTTYTEILELWK